MHGSEEPKVRTAGEFYKLEEEALGSSSVWGNGEAALALSPLPVWLTGLMVGPGAGWLWQVGALPQSLWPVRND